MGHHGLFALGQKVSESPSEQSVRPGIRQSWLLGGILVLVITTVIWWFFGWEWGLIGLLGGWISLGLWHGVAALQSESGAI